MTTARESYVAGLPLDRDSEGKLSGVLSTALWGSRCRKKKKKNRAKLIPPQQASTPRLPRKALSGKQESPLPSPGLRPGGVSQPFLISYTLAQSEITNQVEKETALSCGGCNLLPPMES